MTLLDRLKDRALAWRDGKVADPAFQRWAAGWLPTRGVARRRAQALFDLCAGFVHSQVLYACVELRLFEILAERPHALEELARKLQLAPDATSRLLKAAISLDLVAPRARQRFGLGDLGAAMLGNPAIADMVRHHAMLYADLADPVALLRGTAGPTRLGAYWPYAAGVEAPSSENVAAYSALMSASQEMLAQDILEASPLARRRRLMDVGGGEGVFAVAAARAFPHLSVTLFDLPPVAARAATKFAELGLGPRAQAVGGSFRDGALPTGADVISLVRIAHDHDDPVVMALLRAVAAALPPGGLLLLAEPLAGTKGSERVGAAYFGFYLLAMGSGRARSFAELAAMLAAAGFASVRQIPTRRPMLTCLIEARMAGNQQSM